MVRYTYRYSIILKLKIGKNLSLFCIKLLLCNILVGQHLFEFTQTFAWTRTRNKFYRCNWQLIVSVTHVVPFECNWQQTIVDLGYTQFTLFNDRVLIGLAGCGRTCVKL